MMIDGLGALAERVRRFTVLVEPGERGNGSGVIWSADGTIVTNAHVARGSRARVSLWDGHEFSGEVASRDTRLDLAVLRIPATGLIAAVAADSSQIRPGEVAIAVGNPLGFLGALTMGVVQRVGPLRGVGGQNWVQADVRLAPGNSGGPLADSRGRVIGINTMVAGRLALAIPSNDVTQFLRAGSDVQWLGVAARPVRLPRFARGRIGLLLLEVEAQSPAGMASLMAGDILLGTEAAAFGSVEDLATVLEGKEPRVLRLQFLRGDYRKIRRVSVWLGGQGRSSVAA
jgi:serine protease Do